MATEYLPPEPKDDGNAGFNNLQREILRPAENKINHKKAGQGQFNIDQIKAWLGGPTVAPQDQRALDNAHRREAPAYNQPRSIETKKDAPALISQLGAPKYADREDAAAILEGMSDRALPALRAAINDPSAEISNRAKSMVHRMELRSVLVPGKSIIEADESLRPGKGKDLPDNWSQLSDDIIKQAEKIDKKTLTSLVGQITSSPQEKAQSLEEMDIQRLNEIANYPRLTCAKILSEHKEGTEEQKSQRINKSIDLLAEALEKHEAEPNNQLLLELAVSTNAIENPRFLSVYRQALAASDVTWRTKSDKEVRDQFEKLKKEKVMEPPQAR